ncbi:CLUMA_CG021179, isoform A [Clunio marinus]|uniref:CLUMA_CG021179, isoform A n=1 Tax=Clunio marinus TaxID=568069 RepID=A0A1J1J6X2_9DIPT|nr:CLUMA_CG021179, isoform A [Clunio marinus]
MDLYLYYKFYHVWRIEDLLHCEENEEAACKEFCKLGVYQMDVDLKHCFGCFLEIMAKQEPKLHEMDLLVL